MDGVLRWRQSGDWGWRGGAVTATERAVDARLDSAYRRLERLARRSTPSTDVAAGPSGHEIHCILSPPAAPEQISEAELGLGAPLPADYRRFLLRSNGSLLTFCHPEETTVTLLGTDRLVGVAEAAEPLLGETIVPERVLFATIGDDGDALAFDVARMNPYGGCAVLDARKGYRPEKWWVVACDFTSWLSAMLREMAPSGSFGRSWGLAAPQQLPLPHLDDLPWD